MIRLFGWAIISPREMRAIDEENKKFRKALDDLAASTARSKRERESRLSRPLPGLNLTCRHSRYSVCPWCRNGWPRHVNAAGIEYHRSDGT